MKRILLALTRLIKACNYQPSLLAFLLSAFCLLPSTLLAATPAYPTPPLPYQTLSTTQTIVVLMAGSKTTTFPTYAIAYQDVQETLQSPLGTTGNFANNPTTTVALSSPTAGVRNVSSITICNLDTVAQTLSVYIATSGAPTVPTGGLLDTYPIAAHTSVVLGNAGIISSTPLAIPVTVPSGGTGDATLTAHGVLLGEGTSAVTVTAAGASAALLLGQGAAADPTWNSMSGDITIGATGVTAIGAAKVTNAMLAGSITASKLVGSDIATVGTITTGTWNGSVIPTLYGGTGAALTPAVGDFLYATSGTTFARLADVAVGAYMRSGGVTTAPLWSTLILPNAATQGDILTATSANTVGVLADVAAGSFVRSAGIGATPAYSTLVLPNAATTGDIMYGSAANTMSQLADVAAGSYLRSGGVSTAPVWSTLTIPNAATTGDLIIATGTNALGSVAAVAGTQTLIGQGATTAPVWSTGWQTQPGNYQILAADCNSIIEVTATSTMTLPQASLTKGFRITIQNRIASGTVTIATNATGADGIDERANGVSDVLNAQYSHATYRSTGVAGAGAGKGWVVEDARDQITKTQGTTAVTTTNTPQNLTSFILPPGEWDCTGIIGYLPAATTPVTVTVACVGTTSMSIGTSGINQSQNARNNAAAANLNFTEVVPPQRIVSTTQSSTTLYLVGDALFTISTLNFTGTLYARRLR